MSERRAEAPQADDLLEFIAASPTPWHAAATAVRRFEQAGFEPLDECEPWSLVAGHGYYVVRDASSVIAFRMGSEPLPEAGFRIIGAHTDSPGLRLKPQPATDKAHWTTLGAEVYGGPILATFADRDLTLAGRLVVREAAGHLVTRLFQYPGALVRIPNLAIHMNRGVNDQGLKLEPYAELGALFERIQEATAGRERFRQWLGEAADVDPEALLGFELALCDTQPGIRYGRNGEFLASGQLDNLTSSHAAVEALCADDHAPRHTAVCALFDHEEIGSESYKGAAGQFLKDVIERIGGLQAWGIEGRQRALAASWLLSADTAHAYNPNFPAYYDDDNPVHVNAGPTVKINAKQRYATDLVGEGFFTELCAQAGVPVQKYVHRANLPCGSTIGPISAAGLGVRTIDVGSPIWSMHSIRESGGALDQDYLVRAMCAFVQSDLQG